MFVLSCSLKEYQATYVRPYERCHLTRRISTFSILFTTVKLFRHFRQVGNFSRTLMVHVYEDDREVKQDVYGKNETFAVSLQLCVQ